MDPLTIAGLVIASATAGAGGATAYATVSARRQTRNADRFREIRTRLKTATPAYLSSALVLHNDLRPEENVPLLTRRRWIPELPLSLESVKLTLHSEHVGHGALAEAKRQTRKYWPASSSGSRIKSYSEAIATYDCPSLWLNRVSYRLMSVDAGEHLTVQDPVVALGFALGNYFDFIDTSDALGFEMACRLDSDAEARAAKLPYRQWLNDPFDFSKRCCSPGINVLTIRRATDGRAHFFLQQRSSDNVAIAANILHVTPAIEFQPGALLRPVAGGQDFDLWHATMRAYVAEFLGADERSLQTGTTDYMSDEHYAKFAAEQSQSGVQVHYMGIGLDPLTWKPEILVCCVFEEDSFDRIFDGKIAENSQGPLLRDENGMPLAAGLTFDKNNVVGYARDPRTQPAGRACLALAWRWQHALRLTADAR